jgi:hypothetical protein
MSGYDMRYKNNGPKIAPNNIPKIIPEKINQTIYTIPHAMEAIGIKSEVLPSKKLPKGGRRKTHKKHKTHKKRKTYHKRQ